MSNLSVTSRVALVTGSSRGIGAETARLLAAKGFDVVINCRSKVQRARRVADDVERAGRRALVARADLTNDSATAAMFDQIRDHFGRLDILVLNASGGLERDMPVDYAMRLNRDAQRRTVELALPLLPRGGRIVFVTSHYAHFHGTRSVVAGYEPVAVSKRAGEDDLRAGIPRLEKAGVTLVVVSGDVIDGTITPRLLEREQPGLIEARRQAAGGLPSVREFAAAIASASIDPGVESGTTVYVGSTR